MNIIVFFAVLAALIAARSALASPTIFYQCLRCGETATGGSTPPGPYYKGRCKATVTGKHIWIQTR